MSLGSGNGRDARLALALTIGGLALVAGTLALRPSALTLGPAMDGVLVMGLLGFAFAMLEGLAYTLVLQAMGAVIIVQIAVCLARGASAPALVGLELLVFGLGGLARIARGRPAVSAARGRLGATIARSAQGGGRAPALRGG